MNKELLIRHIAGYADSKESESVAEWLALSEKNREYYAELKNLWIKETMPQDVASEAELESFYKRMHRNKKGRGRKVSLHVIVAYSIAAAAVMFAAYVLLPRSKSSNIGIEELVRVQLADAPKEYVHTIFTEKGVKAQTVLPDGSTVLLNSDSKISYPDKFIGDTREIVFSGEGYFNVVSDTLKPMIIKTGQGVEVLVRGTEFNLRTFDSSRVETTLYSGKITLITDSGDKSHSYIDVLPNTKTCVSDKGVVTKKIMDKITNVSTKAWTDGRIIFDNTPLHKVIEELERWHGVKIIVTDKSILKYKITADFNSESIVQIAELIKLSARIDYRYEDKILYLSAR